MFAEYRRNLWIELSVHRLIATPLILLALWYIISDKIYQTPAQLSEGFFYTAAVIFVFILGAYKATTAVVDEIRDHTWDFQTISPTTPLAMTVGKLFGATSFTWYAGAISLLFVLLNFDNLGHVLSTQIPHLIEFYALFFLLAITCHAVCLFNSISNEYRFYQPSRIGIFIHYLMGLLPTLLLLGIGNNVILRYKSLSPIVWYDIEFEQFQFLMFFIVIALFWSLLASYRAMKMQLRYATWPVAWIAFLAFILFFIVGFKLTGVELQSLPQSQFDAWFRQENMINYKLGLSALIVGVLLYFNLLTRPIDIVKYRKLFASLKSFNLGRAFQYSPVWLYSYLVFLGLVLYLSIKAPSVVNNDFYPASFVFNLSLMALRDIALLHWFSFARPFRATNIWLLYIFLIDFLLPVLMFSFGLKKFVFLFVPTGEDPLVLAALPLVVQIVVLGGLIFNQLRKS